MMEGILFLEEFNKKKFRCTVYPTTNSHLIKNVEVNIQFFFHKGDFQ
jgi:hypothetical protein